MRTQAEENTSTTETDIVESHESETNTVDDQNTPESEQQTEEVENTEAAEDEGYDVVVESDETDKVDSLEKEKARQAYEARQMKREKKKLEQMLDQLKSGFVPEQPQEEGDNDAPPDFDAYFTEEALEKSGHDSTVALARYQADVKAWEKTREQQASEKQEAAKKVNEQYQHAVTQAIKQMEQFQAAADEVKISGYEQAEEAFIKAAGSPDIVVHISKLFGEDMQKQAVATVNYLGKNPSEFERISKMPLLDQQREILLLGTQKLRLQKRSATPKTQPDLGVQGDASTSQSSYAKELKKLLGGDHSAFRKRKKEIEKQLGRRIELHELR